MALRQGRFSAKPGPEVSSHTWYRPSGKMIGQTPPRTRMESLVDFYQDYSNLSKTKIQKKQQKALPAKIRFSETQVTLRELAIGTFFFACRSCEYLKVPAAEKKKTNVLKLKHIQFFKNGRKLRHDDAHLEYANSVSLTFRNQKNGIKDDLVLLQGTGDTLFCPIRSFAKIANRIRNYPTSTNHTPILVFWRNRKINHITSKEMVVPLRIAVEAFGQSRLGIAKEEIGTHSLRAGAAMAMYLGRCPVYVIMMIGRWSSDAFLSYIRKQVEQFSHKVSSQMLRFQFHRHLPEGGAWTSKLDARQESNPADTKTSRKIVGRMAQQAWIIILP